MRALLAITLFAAAPLSWGSPAVSAAWSGLWRTPDQQGQALLDAGQPGKAADRFRDPRRRAYADLQAGRYHDAAQLLAPFTDAESEYNRGNALARAGALQAALAAYDAALKQAPADKDIRHNRDLVARALRQQHPPPQSSRSGGRSGDESRAGQQSAGAGRQSGSGSQQSQSRGGQTGGGGQQASDGSRPGANRPGSSGQQQSGRGNTDAGREAPGQAKRDAEAAAALARQQQQQRGKTGNGGQAAGTMAKGAPESATKGGGKNPGAQSLLAGGTQTPRQKPASERQLALDQWLRQIPDSPAGLLQRKFLIEHMLKQQGDAPEESGP